MATENKEMDGFMNIFTNLLEPFQGGTLIQGSAQYVLIEVLVGQAIRMTLDEE